MFADLGHFNQKSIQVDFFIYFFYLSLKVVHPLQPIIILSSFLLCKFGTR